MLSSTTVKKITCTQILETKVIRQNTCSVDYNLWLKRLDIQFNEPIDQNAIIVNKVVETTNKKTLL